MNKIMWGCILSVGLIMPAYAQLNCERLSNEDIAKVRQVVEALQPLLQERDRAENLSTLTFEELYAPLSEDERAFLKQFEKLDGKALGVKIPFRGLSSGEEDLVVVRGQEITMDGKPYTIPPQFVPPPVYDRYLKMMSAMEKDLQGKRLYIESAYRSSAYQLYLFVYYLKNHDYSIKETMKWVALPGYSEHGAPKFQAIDFINAEGVSGETDPQAFEDLPEFTWLLTNARKFGFVLSYPKHSPDGLTYEPWHWRYETP